MSGAPSLREARSPGLDSFFSWYAFTTPVAIPGGWAGKARGTPPSGVSRGSETDAHPSFAERFLPMIRAKRALRISARFHLIRSRSVVL